VFFFLIICVQLILESLPISSSGHVALVERVSSISIPSVLDALIQIPNFFVIALFFAPVYLPLFYSLLCIHKRTAWSYRRLFSLLIYITICVIVAVAATAGGWVVFKVVLKEWWWLRSDYALLAGFCVTGIVLLSNVLIGRVSGPLNPLKSLIIGIAQGLALHPGISRLGITYTIARWLGMSPRRSFEFSFLIYIPLVIAGSVKDFFLIRDVSLPSAFFSPKMLMVVILGSIISYAALAFTYHCARTKRFWWFGLYMIIPILILLSS